MLLIVVRRSYHRRGYIAQKVVEHAACCHASNVTIEEVKQISDLKETKIVVLKFITII